MTAPIFVTGLQDAGPSLGDQHFDLPPTRPRSVIDWVVAGSLGLLAALPMPTGQSSFASELAPRGPSRSASLLTWTDPLKLELRSQDVFFGPAGKAPTYDWPVPKGPRGTASLLTWSDPLKLELISKDVFFGSAGMGPDYDWPLPTPRKAPPNNYGTWTSAGLSTLSLPMPFGLSDWPLTPGPKGSVGLRTWADQLKLTLRGQDQFFGAAGQAPAQLDWPVTPAARSAIDLRTWLDPLKANLAGKDAFPASGGFDYDYNNPPGPRQGTIELRTWIDPLKQNLQSQDQFTAAGNDFDWPNPQGPRPAAIVLRTHIDQLKLNLAGQDAFTAAGNDFDWPLPQSPRSAIDLRTWLEGGLGLTTIVILPPTLNIDWPVPLAPRSAIDLRTWIDPLKQQLIGQGQAPASGGFDYDFVNPRGAAASIELRTLASGGLSLFVVPSPFALSDWPNPTGPRSAISLRTWADPVKLALIGQDAFTAAGNDFDWPNPLRPLPRQFHIDQLKLLLAGQDATTTGRNSTLDWPVPSGPRQGTIGLRTHIDSLKLLLVGQDQFFGGAGQGPANLDWPVPKGPKASVELLSWIEGFNDNLTLLFPAQITFDWSNPIGPRATVSLRTWVDPVKLELIGRDQFFSVGGPAYDWPNPTAPRRSVTLWSWLDPLKLELIGKDAFTAGGNNFDYPLPQAQPLSKWTLSTNFVQLGNMTPPVVAPPVLQWHITPFILRT